MRTPIESPILPSREYMETHEAQAANTHSGRVTANVGTLFVEGFNSVITFTAAGQAVSKESLVAGGLAVVSGLVTVGMDVIRRKINRRMIRDERYHWNAAELTARVLLDSADDNERVALEEDLAFIGTQQAKTEQTVFSRVRNKVSRAVYAANAKFAA